MSGPRSKPGLQPRSTPSPQKVGTWYFLGCMFVLFALLVWLRGAGRLLIPLALFGLVGYGIVRVIDKVREPLP